MPTDWRVREANEQDALAIAEVHVASIRELGPACYEPDIVDSWATPRDGSPYIRAMAEGERFFVAESSEILGFSSAGMKGGPHVAVYVRGSAARQGVGSALLRVAESALIEAGATEVSIHASLNAAPFYDRHGYRSLGEGEHRLSSGALMRCIYMAKELV